MISLKAGRILEINNSSGHFKPSPEALKKAEQIIRQKMPVKSFDSQFSIIEFN